MMKGKEIVLRVKKDIRAWGGFLLLLLLYDILAQALFHAFCPWLIVTGLPCPGCGMTRAVFYFLTGRFAGGFTMNPLGLCWIALGLYFCVMRYVLGKKPRGALWAGGILAACMAVFYVYRMYRYFPGEPPISYMPGNVLERTIPGYRELLERLRAALPPG